MVHSKSNRYLIDYRPQLSTATLQMRGFIGAKVRQHGMTDRALAKLSTKTTP